MVYAPLLSLAALVLLLNPLPAIGGQTDDVNRAHNGGRCPCLESDEQVKSRTNAYLVIESLDDAIRERLNQTALADKSKNETKRGSTRTWSIISSDNAILVSPDLDDWASVFEEAKDECDRARRITGYFRFDALPWIQLKHGRFLCEYTYPVDSITSIILP